MVVEDADAEIRIQGISQSNTLIHFQQVIRHRNAKLSRNQDINFLCWKTSNEKAKA